MCWSCYPENEEFSLYKNVFIRLKYPKKTKYHYDSLCTPDISDKQQRQSSKSYILLDVGHEVSLWFRKNHRKKLKVLTVTKPYIHKRVGFSKTFLGNYWMWKSSAYAAVYPSVGSRSRTFFIRPYFPNRSGPRNACKWKSVTSIDNAVYNVWLWLCTCTLQHNGNSNTVVHTSSLQQSVAMPTT